MHVFQSRASRDRVGQAHVVSSPSSGHCHYLYCDSVFAKITYFPRITSLNNGRNSSKSNPRSRVQKAELSALELRRSLRSTILRLFCGSETMAISKTIYRE